MTAREQELQTLVDNLNREVLDALQAVANAENRVKRLEIELAELKKGNGK